MRFVLIALCIAAIAACGPRDRALAPSSFAIEGLLTPAGLVVPKGVEAAPNLNYDGLYLEQPDVSVCCWIAPHARLFVRKGASRVTTLVAGFYIPDDVAVFARGQTLRFTFAGSRFAAQRHIGGAFQSVRVAVPPEIADRPGPIPVNVDASVVFVPALDLPQRFSLQRFLHIGSPPPGDDRRLAAILLYAFFQ